MTHVMSAEPATLGLDIGGANLKAAHSSGVARTISFPLWKHPDQLADGLARLVATMPSHDRVAVTMTGELCDCFASKREGVSAILGSVREAFSSSLVRVWCTDCRFLSIAEADERPNIVAAANWLAMAHFVAARFPDECVLLIDTGSTTTDIVYLNHGTPEPRGLTDLERLATGELVYTGVRRTPICAVLGMEVAAEFFATMQDAYLLLSLIPENSDVRDTADGRPATRAAAHARIARLRCADAETLSREESLKLAERAVQTQWRAVRHAMEKVVGRRPGIQRMVVSGSGEILGRHVCGAGPVPVNSLSECLSLELSEAACAYAVAVLAEKERRDGP